MKNLILSLVIFALSACSDFNKEELPQVPIPPTPIVAEPPPENTFRDPEVCETPELLNSWPESKNQLSFDSELNQLSGVNRDRKVLAEIEDGQTGDLQGKISPIKIQKGQNELVYCVFQDYLSLKDGNIPLRMPLGMTALDELIRGSDWTLPTRLMVDQIYQQGEVVLAPKPIPPSSAMSTTPVIVDHSKTINQQLGTRTGLVVGHKKDIVISNRLKTNPQKIAIYGWHQLNGKAIQPLSTVHHKDYADYSHGVRLIYKKVWLNGQAQDLGEVLSDSNLASLLSDEGVLSQSLIQKYY